MNESSEGVSTVRTNEPAPRRRRWLRFVAMAAASAVTLVALAPTFVSFGFFRGTIVGAIAGNVNGSVSVEALEVGWFSPLAVRGLVIDDQAGGTKLRLDAGVEQGLFALLWNGPSRIDAHASGSLRTRREADGTLSVARLPKQASTADAPAPKPAGDAAAALPAGIRSLALALGPFDVEVTTPEGTPHAALRDLQATLAVAAGGETSLKASGKSEYQGTAGSFEVSASLPGLIAADGSIMPAAAGADLSLRATGLAFEAQGLTLRIPDATASVRAKSLAERVEVSIDAKLACDGEAPAGVSAQLTLDRLLAKDGAPAVDLAAIHGRVAVKDLPTRPFERFAAGAMKDAAGKPVIVLARELGRTVELDATFADATGGDLSIVVRSDALKFAAAGSVDPDTRAATFRTVTVDATLAPAFLAGVGLTVSAPSKVEVRATDVSIPAVGADGAFPVDALRVAADLSVTLAGLQLPGPEGLTPLDVRGIRGSLRAAPVGAGIEATLDVATGDPKAQASRIVLRARRGGPYGANGSVTATAIPTSLVRPFLPKSLPVDPARDLGAAITRADLSLSDASPAAFAVKLDAPFAKADLHGTVSAGGALSLAGPGTVELSPMDRGLLAALGVQADASVSAGVTIRRLDLPPASAFDLARVAVDADAGFRPFAQPPVGFRLGTGDAARTVRVTDARVTVATAALGSAVDCTVALRTDHGHLDAKVSAKELRDFSKDAIERAAMKADVKATRIASTRLEAEVPALRGIATELGGATWDVAVAYEGSLLAGAGSLAVRSGETHVDSSFTLAADALEAGLAAGTELKAGKPLAAILGDVPMQLDSPARISLAVKPVKLRRTVPWDFAPPEAAEVSVRAPRVAVSGVPGLQGTAVLDSLALDASVAMPAAGAMGARGSLATELLGARAGQPDAAVAPLRSRFEWTAGSPKAPMAWKADVSLEGIRAAGVAALVDLEDSARAEIGDGAGITARASSLGADGASFEVDSTLKRMAAHLRGEWAQGELRLADSSVDLSLPAKQSTAMLNAAFPPVERPNGKSVPAWKSVDPVAVRATIASLRMKPGAAPSAAVLRAEVKPFSMTTADGERVAVDVLSASVDAPATDRPAAVSAQLALSGAGTAKAGATLDAKVSSWLAADGTFNADGIRVDGGLSCQQASTRLLGTVLGLGTELEDAVGPDLTVAVKAVSKGPGLASGSMSLASRFVNFEAPQVTLRRGMVTLGEDKPVTLDFVPSPPVRKRYLTRVNPILGSLSLAPGKAPFRLTVSALGYPVDGNLAKLSADFRLDIGEVLVERGQDNPLLDQISVFVDQAKVPRSVEAMVEPLVVTVRKGQLSYKDFFVRLERQGAGWKTSLKSTGDVDLVRKPPFARAITVSYPIGCIAREGAAALPLKKVSGTITNVLSAMSLGLGQGTMLRLTVTGPLGDVDGKPGKLEEEWDLEFDGKESERAFDRAMEGLGKGIQKGLQDLIGGGKAPKGGK